MNIATLGLSCNLSLAEDLESLSLQDGPHNGIILSQTPITKPATHPPTASVLDWNISATTSLIIPKFLMVGTLQWRTAFNGGQLSMEDDL